MEGYHLDTEFDKIDYWEFYLAVGKLYEAYTIDHLLIQFRSDDDHHRYDHDKSGKISGDDLRAIYDGFWAFKHSFKKEDIDNIIKDCDLDGDGEIDFDEYLHMMDVPDKLTCPSQKDADKFYNTVEIDVGFFLKR